MKYRIIELEEQVEKLKNDLAEAKHLNIELFSLCAGILKLDNIKDIKNKIKIKLSANKDNIIKNI